MDLSGALGEAAGLVILSDSSYCEGWKAVCIFPFYSQENASAEGDKS